MTQKRCKKLGNVKTGTNQNLSLYSPCYTESCNEFVVPISVSQRQGNKHCYLRRC